jgi:hypothetical protein
MITDTIYQNGNWDRSEEKNAETFATHLSKIFKTNPREITLEEENKLPCDDTTSANLYSPTETLLPKK